MRLSFSDKDHPEIAPPSNAMPTVIMGRVGRGRALRPLKARCAVPIPGVQAGVTSLRNGRGQAL